MPVTVNLDVALAQRKLRLNALAKAAGITESNGPNQPGPARALIAEICARARQRHGGAMKVHLLLIPLFAAGCERTTNSFAVEAPGAASAELVLCGTTRRLERAGNSFVGAYPIHCEGAGTVMLRFPDRAPVSCIVGYVTPGLVQTFRFKVEGNRCRALPSGTPSP